MVKKASVVVLVVLGLALAACSSPQAAQANPGSNSGSNQSSQANQGSGSGTNQTGQGNNGGFASRPVSQEDNLLVGTLDLEATDQAVTAAQAKVLLPLWQQVKTMAPQFNPSSGANSSSTGSSSSSGSSTSSSTGSSSTGTNSSASEMTAVLNQIQQAMTADQLKAINAMHLTNTDVESELTELGVSIPTPQAGSNNFSGTPFPTLSADQRATRIAERQTQAASGGGGNGGSGFGGFQGTPSPNGTPGFRGGNFGGINTVLVNAVINLLTQRAGQ